MKILKAFGIDDSGSKAPGQGDGLASLPEPAQVVLKFLVGEFRDEQGEIHAETILSTSGALCGFAAQRAVWKTMVEQQNMSIEQVFMVVETKDGGRFLFSEPVNQLLVSQEGNILSVWRLVSDMAVKSGARELPDLEKIFARTAEGLGGTPFPNFSTPQAHRPREEPAEALRRLWPSVGTALDRSCDVPIEWPIILGFVSSALVAMTRTELDPSMSATLIMESAVAMSKMTGIEPVN